LVSWLSTLPLSAKAQHSSLFFIFALAASLHQFWNVSSRVVLPIHGVPPNLCAPPPDFQCPICLLMGAQQLASNPAQALIILTKGARFWLIIVLACHRGLWIYHLDVSNAFQSTVDPDPKTFLRCYPEFLLWLEAWHPEAYQALKHDAHPTTPASDFGVLVLYKIVQQGRVDANCQWKHAIDVQMMYLLVN
jgi:hypothetical protein